MFNSKTGKAARKAQIDSIEGKVNKPWGEGIPFWYWKKIDFAKSG